MITFDKRMDISNNSYNNNIIHINTIHPGEKKTFLPNLYSFVEVLQVFDDKVIELFSNIEINRQFRT
jgi:hypothetical protein